MYIDPFAAGFIACIISELIIIIIWAAVKSRRK